MKRTIPNYPLYYATTNGDIYRRPYNKYCGHENSKPQQLKLKKLTPRLHQKGYFHVALWNENGRSDFRWHRIIWETFMWKIPQHLEINHKDGKKYNNVLANLETVSHLENMKHAQTNGLMNQAKGSKNGMSKLKENDIRVIRKLKKENQTYSQIGKIYDMSITNIARIVNREIWQHVK